MPDIFLSYNREDQARAKLFAEAFEAQGFKVWWDVGLRTGEAYDEVTETALRTAKAVVVLWSKKSVVSRWVRAEATLADRNRTLVPCMIETCERPIMFELTQTAELGHWKGDAGDKAWVSFFGDVRRFVEKGAAPAVDAATALLAAPTVEETLKPGQSGSAPSLAVLPFTNRSNLADDTVFAEGMVEDVISALSQGVNVRVLGATATANLNRAGITDLPAVGQQLGVRYLLEGNVRRVGANLRVTTQLLEAATGEIAWVAKFDRPLSELAELQEELVTEIAAHLDTQVYALEMERALKKPGDITAWEAVARSQSAYRKFDAAARAAGIEEAKRAIAIAPDHAPGHAVLAQALANAYLVSPDDADEAKRIRAIAERALALAPDDAMVLANVGAALSQAGYPEEGVRHTERALRKAPGIGTTHLYHAGVCVQLNRPEEALAHLGTAERLGVGAHATWRLKGVQTCAYCALDRWADADAAADDGLRAYPLFAMGHVWKALFCQRLGRDVEARRHLETACRMNWQLEQAERLHRRMLAKSPTLEANVAIIRTLYAAAEPGK